MWLQLFCVLQCLTVNRELVLTQVHALLNEKTSPEMFAYMRERERDSDTIMMNTNHTPTPKMSQQSVL